MAISPSVEPITASDDALQRALDDAFLPALLPALAQATGDLSILHDDLLPAQIMPGALQGGMTEEQQQSARALAFDALRRVRDNGIAAQQTDSKQIRAIIEWMTRTTPPEEYIALLLEELAPAEDDPRAPRWQMDTGTAFQVVIVGAGMSGILAGIRLKQAGVPFVIVEKNEEVGGTWFENTYPGARVDVQNAFYSYSFAQKIDWPKYFSPQDVLLDYFRSCVDDYGIRGNIRFGTEVIDATFDDERAQWTLRLRTPAGDETLVAQAMISAVGQLNRPNIPEIAGSETFAGPLFHSARWDHSVDLTGKRVAVIGTGASAAQFIPAIAPDVAELHVFQRTPNWFVPVPTYHDDVAEGLQWLLGHVPYYAHWYRFWMFSLTTEGLLAAAIVDDAWPHKDRSVSMENDVLRALLTGYIQAQFADRPDLLEKALPSYPPAAKRMILDNGVWASTLKRDNVHLITDAIERITPRSIVTADGVEREVDVIVYGTGFQASKFLTPMKVFGRDGTELFEQWQGDARAYMGIVVPNFPNFFMCYGPNTNIVVNGSIIYFSECEVQYILGCLRLLFDRKQRALDCKRDVHDAYNQKIDAANRKRAWGASGVNSWYKNDRGRVSQNWPFNAIEYWQQTREPDPADFAFL
ncbi:MAG TPA: NAD(P)/FAD-dependent oxidoreductase [Dehalococcoidia bacterium]